MTKHFYLTLLISALSCSSYLQSMEQEKSVKECFYGAAFPTGVLPMRHSLKVPMGLHDNHLILPGIPTADTNRSLFAILSDESNNTGAPYSAGKIRHLVLSGNTLSEAFEASSNGIRQNGFTQTSIIAALIDQIHNCVDFAWTGNFRALIADRNNAATIVATKSTLVCNKEENKRINKQGCYTLHTKKGTTTITPQGWATVVEVQEKNEPVLTPVSLWKKDGQTYISRILGDRNFQPYVTAKPCEDAYMLTENSILIMAGNGVWDVIMESEAYDIVKKALDNTKDTATNFTQILDANSANSQEGNEFMIEAAKALTQAAQDRGSKDNVSSIVVTFKKPTL